MAPGESGRIFPRLDLALDQPFERPRDLPFLIALSAGWQRSGFSYKLRPGLEHVIHIEKVRMSCHGRPFGQAGATGLSVTGRCRYRTVTGAVSPARVLTFWSIQTTSPKS